MASPRYSVASAWLMLVLVLGTAYFAAQNTAPVVLPFLKVLAPSASNAQLHATHHVVRKLAHVVEYAVLALLWFRALLRGAGRTPRTAAWMALSVCLVCAFVDEAHQATLPTRSASARDLVIDASGAVGMLMLARGRNRGLDGAIAVEPGE